jgi:hypothetical protein
LVSAPGASKEMIVPGSQSGSGAAAAGNAQAAETTIAPRILRVPIFIMFSSLLIRLRFGV